MHPVTRVNSTAAGIKANEAMLALWKKSGIEVVTLTADEKKAWVAAVGHNRSEYNGLKDAFGRSAFDKIVELQG